LPVKCNTFCYVERKIQIVNISLLHSKLHASRQCSKPFAGIMYVYFMKSFLLCLFISFYVQLNAQENVDAIYKTNIKTVKFFQENNQESLPVIRLNSNDLLELHFDDLDGLPKSYFYSFELCNADWQTSSLSSFDYVKGYQQQNIAEYRISSVSLQKYVHYTMLFPQANYMPTKSGNYILKVFLDADPDKLVFTKRFFVVENKVAVLPQLLQTFDNQKFNTHQKLQFSINTLQLNLFSAQQQIKVTVLQNYKWINAVSDVQPSFIRNNVLEYNGEEDFLFAGTRENRWADLRSFDFQSDRIAGVDKTKIPYEIFLKPDAPRMGAGYFAMKDLNGWYYVSSTEVSNPWWQGGYANVHFTFVPKDAHAFDGKDVYLIGELTGNTLSDDAKMSWNENENVYEKNLLLKQGYYSYNYATKNKKSKENNVDYSLTEGNFWETENDYTILVYYRSISGRYDELVAVKAINSHL